LNPDGEVVHKIVGGKQADELIKSAGNAIDPSKSIVVIAEKYNNGERDLPFVLNYIDLLDEAYDSKKSEEVSKDLLKKFPVEKFASKKKFVVIANAKVDYGSKEYKYVVANKNMLLKEVDSAQYNGVVGGAISKYLIDVSENAKSLNEVKAAIEICKKDYVSEYQDDQAKGLTYNYYLSKKDYNKWFELKFKEGDALKGTEKYVYFMHNIGQEVLANPKFEGSQESLDKALKLAKEIANTNDGIIMGNFLLAKLYLKKGDKEKALAHYNVFFNSNAASGGLNDHPSVHNLKAAIDIL